jgi:hypothetical protein
VTAKDKFLRLLALLLPLAVAAAVVAALVKHG